MKYFRLTIFLCLLQIVNARKIINTDQAVTMLPAAPPPRPQTTSLTTEAKWINSNLPLTVEVASELSDYFTLIQDMAIEWKLAGNSELDFFYINPSLVSNKDLAILSDYLDGEIGIYKSTNWFSEISPFAIAITQYWGYRKNVGTANEYIELSHADLILNYKNFTFTSNNTAGSYDLPSIVLHEMGHMIGLPHIYGLPSIMGPTISSATQNRIPLTPDKIVLANNYGININMQRTPSASGFSTASKVSSDIKKFVAKSKQEGEFVRVIHEFFPN